MKNHDNVNELIRSLVKSFGELDKSLKNKIIVNSIFSSLDDNTSKNLNKLINYSDLRYKSVKSGGKLTNIIKKQKPKYELLVEELKNDKLYSTNVLNKEKAKLFKNSLVYKNKEIYELRNKLKHSLKKTQTIFNIKKEDNQSPKHHIPRLRNMIKKASKLLHLKTFFKNKLKTKRLEKQNEKLMNILIEEDYKSFHNKIENYQNFLGQIRTMSENNTDKKGLKIDKTFFKEALQSINPNSFKALTYRDCSYDKNKKIKKKDFEFDLRKIKNIKMSHDKNYNNILKNKNSKMCRTEYNTSLINNFSSRNKGLNSYNQTENFRNTINTDNNPKEEMKNKCKALDKKIVSNFKNTAYIVLNESENGLNNEENFVIKRNKLNSKFKYFKTYNEMFNNNKIIATERESIRKSIHIPNLKEVEYKNNLNKNDNNIEIMEYTERPNDKIREKFQEIYELKKLKWEKEDKLKELKKERDKQNMLEISKFLYEIQDKKLLKRNNIK